MAGNASPHFFSGSTTWVLPEGASLMLTVQVLSRSALDNSHVPTMALTASLGPGACAAAGPNPSPRSTTAARSERASEIMAEPYHGDRRRSWRGWRLGYCGFDGGHAVSGTGVSGGFPDAQASRLSTTSCSMARRVCNDAEPRWGNSTT